MKMKYPDIIINLARETNSTVTELQSEILRFIASHLGHFQKKWIPIRGKMSYDPRENHPYYDNIQLLIQEIKKEDISIFKLCSNCLTKIEECSCERSGEEQEYQIMFKVVDHVQEMIPVNIFIFYGITAEKALNLQNIKKPSKDGLKDFKKTDYNICKKVFLRGRIIEDTKIFIVYDLVQKLKVKKWEDTEYTLYDRFAQYEPHTEYTIFEFEDIINEPLAQNLVDLSKEELIMLEKNILTSIKNAYEKELFMDLPDLSNLKKFLGDKFEKIRDSMAEWEFFNQFGKDILNEPIEPSPESFVRLWDEETTFKGISLSKLESLILSELENKFGMNLITYKEHILSTSQPGEKWFNKKGEEIEVKDFLENVPDEDLPNQLLSPTNNFIEFTFKVKIKECHVEGLNLEYIPCSELPQSIGWLFSLRKLDLCGMGLKLIPDSIENLVKLEELDLYRNELINLPSSLLNLRRLKKILINKRTVLQARPSDFSNILRELENRGVQVIKLEDSNEL